MIGSVFTLALLATPPAPPVRFALVIGHNAPLRDDLPPLRYADDDAIAMAALLGEAGAEVHLLVDPDPDTQAMHPDLTSSPPTWPEVERAFDAINEAMGARRELGGASELLVFYSGHGDTQDDQGVVALADGVLGRDRLHQLLRRSVARRNHVIVDACRSYQLLRARGPGGERQPFTGELDDLPPRTGFVVSTSADQQTHEWDRFGAGVFTHELRSALRGAADADDDSTITYAELGAFLGRANHAIPNPTLRPAFVVQPPGSVDTALLEWPAVASGVVVDVADGPLFFEDHLGERLADVHALEPVRLRLPAGRPVYAHRRGDDLERTVEAEGWSRLSGLPPAAPRAAPKGARHIAFESLFSQAFAVEDVAAYRTSFVVGEPRVSETAPPARSGWLLPVVAGGAAAALLLGGVAATVVASQQRDLPPGASQQDIHGRNEAITSLNVAAVVSYVASAAVAAVCGFVWLTGDEAGQDE